MRRSTAKRMARPDRYSEIISGSSTLDASPMREIEAFEIQELQSCESCLLRNMDVLNF